MDLKKFGFIIFLIGFSIAGYGGFYWFSNQSQQYQRPEGVNSIMGGLDAMGAMLQMQDGNRHRAEKRNDALKSLAASGIVMFLGLGVVYSEKKPVKDD